MNLNPYHPYKNYDEWKKGGDPEPEFGSPHSPEKLAEFAANPQIVKDSVARHNSYIEECDRTALRGGKVTCSSCRRCVDQGLATLGV